MPAKSAGLLLFRLGDGGLELLIAHPGGPLWARKDDGAWSIIKGEYEQGEDALSAARREFEEETGAAAPGAELPAIALGEVRQPGGKRILAWAIESDFDAEAVTSNTFTLEWPRSSGRVREFPEIDRASWFDAATAKRKLLAGQLPFIERLEQHLAAERGRRPQRTSVAP